jgi:hypothetical protein
MAARWGIKPAFYPAGASLAWRSHNGSIQLKMQRVLAIFEGAEEIRYIGVIDGFARRIFHKVLF